MSNTMFFETKCNGNKMHPEFASKKTLEFSVKITATNNKQWNNKTNIPCHNTLGAKDHIFVVPNAAWFYFKMMLTVTTKHGQGTIYSFWCKIRCASINCCAVKNEIQNLKTKTLRKNVCTRPHKNVPSPLFLYVFFAFFSIWLFHLKCISHGRRGTSNIKMFHTGWKLKSTIHLSFRTIKRSNLWPQLLAFACVSFATLFGSETEKVSVAGVFQPNFRIFVKLSHE